MRSLELTREEGREEGEAWGRTATLLRLLRLRGHMTLRIAPLVLIASCAPTAGRAARARLASTASFGSQSLDFASRGQRMWGAATRRHAAMAWRTTSPQVRKR